MPISTTRDNEKVFTDTQPKDQVEVRVRAVAPDGRVSQWSEPKTITCGDNTPPDDPTNFSISPSPHSCLLKWDFPTCNDYKHTEVFRKTVNTGVLGFYTHLVSSYVTGDDFLLFGKVTAEAITVPGDIDAQYCFKIRHVDNAGNKSNFSTVLCTSPRKIKPIDIHQDPSEDNIYIKPKEGIPNADLLFSYEDGYGVIVNTNGTDFYDGLRADLANLDTAIGLNSDDIGSINDDITDLNSDLSLANQAITNNSDDIDTLNTGLNNANTNIATNTSNISTLTSGLNTANTNISSNTSAINTANTNIGANTGNIATNTANISTLTTGLNTANTNIGNNTSNISALTSGLSSANNSIATNASNITTNASNISALTSGLSLANTNIAKAYSVVNITTPSGTLGGTYSITTNGDGMKSITYNIDVNSAGLANALNQYFIIREGQTTTSVTGQIVSQS